MLVLKTVSADISISITLCNITTLTLLLSEGIKGSGFFHFERDNTCQLKKLGSERAEDAVQERRNHRDGTSLSLFLPSSVFELCVTDSQVPVF